MAESARVVLDARGLQGADAQRGIGSYSRGLISGLLRAGWGPRLGLLLDGGLPFPELPAETGIVVYSVRRRYRGRLATWEDAVALGSDLQRIRPRLYHALGLALPGRAPCPVVVTVHDLIPWAWREGAAAMRGERLRYRAARRRLPRADRVIAVSEATARDAGRLAGVAADRIAVIPEGVDPRFRRQPGASGKKWGIERPYLVFVGALDARKDPAGLLAAWRAAQAAGADCELVLAGPASRQAPAAMEGALRLGYLSTEELAELLSAAACLLFPSRYEGFGLPVLEAMACGCPVAAYDNSSLPEVADGAATLVADGDAVGLGRAAAAYVLDAELAKSSRSKGQGWAKRFTWDRAAEQTIELYQPLLG
ncbi:MAG TPA: glycosyltransferase family 1 protein [Candidatus Dormibacteraeota bacterium]